jgi:hypothetical protein
MNIFLIGGLIAVLGALAAAGFFLVKERKDDEGHPPPRVSRVTKALTLRIGLSVFLFVCLLLAWKFGYIQPTGLPIQK